MTTLAIAVAVLTGMAVAQEPAREGHAEQVARLRREQVQNRARLERLVELKILMDLGGPVSADVLASLLPPGPAMASADLAAQLRDQEQRLVAQRDRLVHTERGGNLPPPQDPGPLTLTPPGSAPALVELAPPRSPATQPAARPGHQASSQPASTSRPILARLAKAEPSARVVYTLVQSGHLEEAKAALAELPEGSAPPAMAAFLAATIAERGGDLVAAERLLLKAMGEATKVGRNQGAVFETMKLALDHVTWKRNRAEFQRLLQTLAGTRPGT